MEMDKEKRVPPDRQKEAEQQLPPEVEAKMNELSPKAFAIADQTIAAYGLSLIHISEPTRPY